MWYVLLWVTIVWSHTSGIIRQWFSGVAQSRMKNICESHRGWPKSRYLWQAKYYFISFTLRLKCRKHRFQSVKRWYRGLPSWTNTDSTSYDKVEIMRIFGFKWCGVRKLYNWKISATCHTVIWSRQSLGITFSANGRPQLPWSHHGKGVHCRSTTHV